MAKAQADQIDVDIERKTIRAPFDGRVLQMNTRVGEYAQSGAASSPLMLFGDDKLLYFAPMSMKPTHGGFSRRRPPWPMCPATTFTSFLK